MASKAKVLYSFDGEQANNEISIVEGEVLTIVNPNIGDGWWEGINSKGTKGLFPASYVEPISNSALPTAPTAPLRSQLSSQSTDNDADSWDEDWDDDEGERPYSPSSRQQNGDTRQRTTSVSRNATIKKSLNRFSVFVKSGGESFLLGKTTAEDKSIMANDVALIRETTEGGAVWDQIREPFTCVVTQPEKKSKFKGMKHFIAYNVTPSSTGVSVSRRFKHFDWLYCRLLEKFTCLSIPPIPEKQITGKYAEDFVEKRRERLERWLNRLCRHPVVHKSDVFHHFLYCNDNEKEWKAGKRKAEHDKLCGAAFFLTVKSPSTTVSVDDADARMEDFALFCKIMEDYVQRLNERCRSRCLKFEGVFRNTHKKFGSSFFNLSTAFEHHNSEQSRPLTEAIAHTGRTYDKIGDLFNEQPRIDLQHLMEVLHEYNGILTTFPEIVHVHKSTVEKVKECERKQNDEKVEADLVEQVHDRANVITNVTFAEISLFHEQRVVDFKEMMQGFLREQITFYQGIVTRLQDSLEKYENV